MDDIQEKEKIYNAATAAVNTQEEKVSATAIWATQTKDAYLQSIVHAAVLSEKIRRKRDSLIKRMVYAIVIAISLLLLLVNDIIAALFVAAVLGISWIIKWMNSNEDAVNYNNRRAFFSKYFRGIPEAERLKWKNIPMP